MVKDYGLDYKTAAVRANKFVNITIGRLYGEWTMKRNK